MEELLQRTVNLWYREWLKTNNAFKSDFKKELNNAGLGYMFTLNHNTVANTYEWILIK